MVASPDALSLRESVYLLLLSLSHPFFVFLYPELDRQTEQFKPLLTGNFSLWNDLNLRQNS